MLKGGLRLADNVLRLGGRFNAAKPLLGDRYFLCGGIYEY